MFKIGNYVHWLEYYDDGMAGKDWGDGTIIDKRVIRSSYCSEYLMYKVYRDKYKDFYWFEKRQLRSKETK